MTLLRRSNAVHESGGVDVLPESGSRGCDVGRAALLWCRRLSSHLGNSARPQKSYAHRHLFAVLSKPNFVGRSIDCPDQVRNESDPLCGRPRVAGAIELRDPRDAGLSRRQRLTVPRMRWTNYSARSSTSWSPTFADRKRVE